MIRFAVGVMVCSLAIGIADEPKHVGTTPVQRPENWCKTRHEQFNKISKEGTAQIVFLGDSITQGWEGAGKDAWAANWAPLKAANFGIGGDRTEHVLWRLENGNFQGLKPKLVVLMNGTNNTGHRNKTYSCSAEQTADGVKAIVSKLRTMLPETKILLLATSHAEPSRKTRCGCKTKQPTQSSANWMMANTSTTLTSARSSLSPMERFPKSIMPDLLHLSPEGYGIWANAIKDRSLN